MVLMQCLPPPLTATQLTGWNENENSQDMFIDNKLAAHGVATLTNVSAQQKATGQPFFVAVGLHRPHLPWDVPEEYYELYTAAGRKPIGQ